MTQRGRPDSWPAWSRRAVEHVPDAGNLVDLIVDRRGHVNVYRDARTLGVSIAALSGQLDQLVAAGLCHVAYDGYVKRSPHPRATRHRTTDTTRRNTP